MNIQDLLPVKTFNYEAAVQSQPYGTGTFTEIVEKIYDGTITLLVDNSGRVIGGSYNTGKTGIEDSVEQARFERRYMGKPVQTWVEKAVQLKAQGVKIASVQEDGNDISVITESGETIVVSEAYHPAPRTNSNPDLPTEVTLGWREVGDPTLANVRKALKGKYHHCLAKGTQPDITVNAPEGNIEVSNIQWGRKLSDSELAVL